MLKNDSSLAFWGCYGSVGDVIKYIILIDYKLLNSLIKKLMYHVILKNFRENLSLKNDKIFIILIKRRRKIFKIKKYYFKIKIYQEKKF